MVDTRQSEGRDPNAELTAGPAPDEVADATDPDPRQRWSIRRSALETDKHKHNRYGKRRKSRWSLFEMLIRLFGTIIRYSGLHDRGTRNARDVRIHEVDAILPDLPTAFHGYRILQLTDLHLDFIKDMGDIICARLRDVCCDLCVLTGDYRAKTHGRFHQVLDPLRRIVDTADAGDGVLAVLGNHDTVKMAAHLGDMGVRLVANETIVLQRGANTISITGIDDPHYYYTDETVKALSTSGDGFKICLVHTPELYDIAAAEGYRLYLCGHTHGGQICLPGGFPVITHLYAGRRFARGLWRFGGMIGYTSTGCGAVGIPLRFNCPGEIAVIRLRNH